MSPRRARHDEDADELATTAARFARGRWRRDHDDAEVWTLRDGERGATLIASAETAAALLDALSAVPDELSERDREIRRLRERIEDLEARASEPAGKRGADKTGGARTAPDSARGAPATLENVPLALVAGFRPTAQMTAAAKKDPLLALAVQATKAVQPDASELDRARLVAMAYAASRGDLDAFWAASKQRSVKKAKR